MATRARNRPSRQERGYGREHELLRAEFAPLVASGQVRCARCRVLIRPGERWDLGHVDGDRSQYSGPEHAACNRATSARRLPRPPRPWETVAPLELERERDGLAWSDKRWRVPWLKGLRRPPADATWPRLMTVPHPAATGSLGWEFIAWAEERTGRPLRWWQRLVAVRLLETDRDGALVWETMVLSMARQLGKSWLLRELLLWRIHQGDRFGEPQDVMHTGKDLAICKEVQRPARLWAKARPGVYKVREVNGQEEIEHLVDGSRWMLRAKEAVYGYSVSLGAADEAWKVKQSSIEEGLTPTMAERLQPQLLLVSTAHRMATALMLSRRQAALVELESGQGDLLVEWSAPQDAGIDDLKGWRLASPHWTAKRERLIRKQLDALRAGEIDDPEEPDPEQSFRAQWLNQWPRKLTDQALDEDLLPAGAWAALTVPGLVGTGELWVALEDDYGYGAAAAAAARLDDGRIEVDGWLCPDWNSALEDAVRLAGIRRVRQLLVGASMLSRCPPGMVPVPHPAGSRETRVGLPLLRDLVAGGMIAHDENTRQLDEALAVAQVREQPQAGLQLAPRGPTHLIRALVWAVNAAHRPLPVPAVH